MPGNNQMSGKWNGDALDSYEYLFEAKKNQATKSSKFFLNNDKS